MLAVLVRAEDKSARACPGVLHGGDAVAADERSGQSWQAQKRIAGRATAAAKSRVTRGEGEQGVDGGDLHDGGQGGGTGGGAEEAESRGGSEEEDKREKRPRTHV
jgi:hypothetical protein